MKALEDTVQSTVAFQQQLALFFNEKVKSLVFETGTSALFYSILHSCF